MCRFSAIMTLAALSVVTLSAKSDPHTQLPDEIAQFYRACNHVSVLSTPEERTRMAASADNGDSSSLPRYSHVQSLLREIESRVVQHDPGMVIPSAPRWTRWIHDGVIEIRKVRTDLDRIFVEVRSRPVSAATRIIFLSSLDRQGRGSDLESRAGEAIGRVVEPVRSETVEIHQWIRRGDMWFVSEVKVQLVKPVARF